MPITKQIEKTLYTFDELSNEAKRKAITWWKVAAAWDPWHEYIIDVAKEFGLAITAWDVDCNTIGGEFSTSAVECSEAILSAHGKDTATYRAAKAFDDAIDTLPELPDEDANGYAYAEREHCNAVDALEQEFLDALLQAYLGMLQKEYEHYYSFENAAENIRLNEYTFTIDGKREDF